MEPGDVQTEWVARFNNRDLEGVVGLYEPAAAIVNNRGAEPQWGHEAIRRILGELIATDVRAEGSVVKVIRAGETAQLHTKWRLLSRDGFPLVSAAAVSVLRRQPGGTWRYVVNDLFGGASLVQRHWPVEDDVQRGAGRQLDVLAAT